MKLHEFRMRHPYASFVFVVSAALVVTTLQGCQIQQNRDTIHRLQKVTRQQAKDREENIGKFAASDYTICIAVEKLYKQRRDEALESYRNLDRTLRLLGLKRTAEIERLARENRDRTLRRFAPRPGGCGSLPSNG